MHLMFAVLNSIACVWFLSREFSGFLREKSEEQKTSEGEPLGRKTRAAGCQSSLA